jgi:hypothetical protein
MLEKTKDTAVFNFGRFQPPTTGHALLVNAVASEAKKETADAFIFISSNRKEPKRNPLTVLQKLNYMKKMFHDVAVTLVNTEAEGCTTPNLAADALISLGYKKIIMIVGSDRESQFEFLKKKGVEIRRIGPERTNEGMSGTKMRKAAANGDFNSFQAGVKFGAATNANVRALMTNVRKGLGLNSSPAGASTRKNRSGSKGRAPSTLKLRR